MYQFCHGSAQFCPKRLQFARLFTPCLPFLLLIAPSVTSKSKPCALLNGSHCTMYNGSKLNWPKKASVSISTQNLPALGILNVLKTPYALAWSSLEIVQFITQWVLSLHGLSFSLCSVKRAEACRPIRAQQLEARPIRSLDSLNSPPIVWPSVGGPSRREQGGTLPWYAPKALLGIGWKLFVNELKLQPVS